MSGIVDLVPGSDGVYYPKGKTPGPNSAERAATSIETQAAIAGGLAGASIGATIGWIVGICVMAGVATPVLAAFVLSVAALSALTCAASTLRSMRISDAPEIVPGEIAGATQIFPASLLFNAALNGGISYAPGALGLLAPLYLALIPALCLSAWFGHTLGKSFRYHHAADLGLN